MPFSLPELNYSKDALAPHISAETIEYHYGKHHKAYVDKLNAAIEGTPDAEKSLEDIVRSSKGGVFNNAAQVWNHTFYWNSLSPSGGGEPTGELAQAINKTWGDFQGFKEAFSTAAAGQFGSGWAWLVKKSDGTLAITTTANAETPLTDKGQTALMTCDVWEHAYYVDYRNARPKYIEAFWNLVNWDFAAKNFKS
jgi:Fe-Mn family superoxide dismutase